MVELQSCIEGAQNIAIVFDQEEVLRRRDLIYRGESGIYGNRQSLQTLGINLIRFLQLCPHIKSRWRARNLVLIVPAGLRLVKASITFLHSAFSLLPNIPSTNTWPCLSWQPLLLFVQHPPSSWCSMLSCIPSISSLLLSSHSTWHHFLSPHSDTQDSSQSISPHTCILPQLLLLLMSIRLLC